MRYEAYAPHVPEFRSARELDVYLSEHYPSMPAHIRAVAVESWEKRNLRRAEPPSATELKRRLDQIGDEIRRSVVAALGRELRDEVDLEDLESDDPEDVETLLDECPKCGSDDLDMEWDGDSNQLEVSCLRCGYRYQAAGLDQRSIRRALMFNEIRRHARY